MTPTPTTTNPLVSSSSSVDMPGLPLPEPGDVIVVWFSNGAASAIAWAETLRRYGDICDVRAVNNPIAEEDEDNLRFAQDVAAWLGKPLQFWRNPRFAHGSAVKTWDQRAAMAFPHGAPCTEHLKKGARQDYEKRHTITWHVFGFTAEERKRHDRFVLTERSNVLPVLIEAGLTKQDCMDRLVDAGVAPPRVYAEGYPNANCFTAETRFLTRSGVRSLGGCVGQSVQVRTSEKGSPWRNAEVRSFGMQEVVELDLRRGRRTKTIRTTKGHRWFVGTRKHRREVTTDQLSSGDRLVSAHTALHTRIAPSPWGIARGITFGDGSLNGGSRGASARLVLCGAKDLPLLRYFPLSPTKQVPAGIEVTGLPRDWKTCPSLDLDDSFLFGWLAGYFAADGCASKDGDYTISSARLSDLEYARDVAVRLGISVNPIRTAHREGFGATSDLHTLPLVGATLRPEFFLIDQHRARFEGSTVRDPHPWFVEAVRETGVSEEVFCVVEPVSQTFVLEHNILTGNCIGCVKATSPTYWNLVRRTRPEVFAARAEQSRRLGARLARHKGKRIFLDELPADAVGRSLKTMTVECGVFCEERPFKDAAE